MSFLLLVRTKHIFGDTIIHAVTVVLVTAAAVKTKILSVMLAHTWTFQRVPVKNVSVHFALTLEKLPVVTRAHHRFFFTGQFRHADEFVHDERRARANFVRKIQK